MADRVSGARLAPARATRSRSLRPTDVLWVAAANAGLIIAMWIRHGGLNGLTTPGTLLIAGGQLTALLGTYLALIGLVLMSRSPWLDRLFGLPRLAHWHRWVGFGCVWLLVAHTILTTVGFGLTTGSDALAETVTLLTTYPYVLMATVGLVMLVAVGITSVRIARRRLTYETWYFVHLYAYLGMALGFAHQLVVGTDFLSDQLAQAYWVALYLVTIVAIVVFRFGQPVQLSLRHRLRVARVTPEGPGVVSVYVTGRRLDRLAAQAGQFFLWRFLAGDGWWRAHPFSLSAAPNEQYLRLTVKATGDGTSVMQRLQPGTPVFVEGPYGAFTADQKTVPRVLLIAGGIGITPLRALLEAMPAPRGVITLIYRASRWEDVVFGEELEALARSRGARVHYLVGHRFELRRDPLDGRSLRHLVPDIAEREIYVCGPEGMIRTVKRSLRQLRVPASRIHEERFAY
jgi:predicted ferric reductase